MEINLSDRIKECQTKAQEAVDEINDYQILAMCIKTLSEVTERPERYEQTNEESYNLVVERIRKLCAKHKILLPDYIEWGAIELK